MTTAHDIDWPAVLAQPLTTTHPDALRDAVAFINALMGAEADVLCGADYGQRRSAVSIGATVTGIANWIPGPARWSWRSPSCGKVPIPGLAAGRRQRAERALVTVVATCYLLGVSTRRMESWSSAGDQEPVEVAGVGHGEVTR